MKKIRAILVDDEPRGLSSLQKLLLLNCPNVEVVGTCSSAEEAGKKIETLNPDLLFLDIAMPGQSGFDLLKNLPEINFEIIFVTAYNDYMTQAFHFSAIDYLLKPVEDELLIEAVRRVTKRLGDNPGKLQLETLLHNLEHKQANPYLKLCIPSVKGFQVIEIQNIIYCEASSNYTIIHFTDRTEIVASKSIYQYEELLADCSFVRTHKSFLVNLEQIKEYIRGEGGSVILSNGHEVEVSRRKKDLLMTRMKEYYKF